MVKVFSRVLTAVLVRPLDRRIACKCGLFRGSGGWPRAPKRSRRWTPGAFLLQPQCSLVLTRPRWVSSSNASHPGGGRERVLDMARALVPDLSRGTWRSLPEVALDQRPR